MADLAQVTEHIRGAVGDNSGLGKTVKLDAYGNPIYDVQIRKVVKRADGKYWNAPAASSLVPARLLMCPIRCC